MSGRPSSSRRRLARALVSAFLTTDWTPDALLAAGLEVVPRAGAWMRSLVRRLRRKHRPKERIDALTHAVELGNEVDRKVRLRARVAAKHREAPAHPLVRRWLVVPTEMAEPRWPVPELATVGDLAAWLELSVGDLAWLADRGGWNRRAVDPRLAHYDARWIPKRSGGARLLEAPRSRLAAIQRRILHEILDHVPPHDASHGFRRGHSTRDFVAPHVARGVVVRIDLEDFFASVTAGRVLGIFLGAGYPDEVARTLTALSTTRTPSRVLRGVPAGIDVDAHARSRARLRGLHLPQGAPTSPALASLAAFRLDARLASLALSADARYTRYADDLAFSFDARSVGAIDRFIALVETIVLDESFRVGARKTRVMRRGARQALAGVVIGQRPNVAREDYDRLRAILHRCALEGPRSQNRDGLLHFREHLLGRIGWVASWNEARGVKLRTMFDAIPWDE